MSSLQTIRALLDTLPHERLAHIDNRKNELPYEMALYELRLAIAASRKDLA